MAKVKAHQDLTSLAAGTEKLWKAQGNDHADVQAKQEAARHLRPAPVGRELYNLQEVALEAFLRFASEALQLWPVPQRKRKQARPKPRPCRQPSAALQVGIEAATEAGGPWITGQVVSGLHVPRTALSPGQGSVFGDRLLPSVASEAELVGAGVFFHEWAQFEHRWICRVC